MGRKSDILREETEVRLTQWRHRIIRVLGGSVYETVKEDVAQEIILEMTRSERNGRPVYPCPPRLPRVFRQQVMRIGRRLIGGLRAGNPECEAVEDPDNDEREVMADCAQMQLLQRVFSEIEISQMVEVARRGPFRLVDLAQAIDMPIRTFHSRLKELRV